MAKFSTGLRTKMLDTGSFKDIMDLGFLKIYGGEAAPSSADAAIPGGSTLLCTLSNDGGVTGLTFDAAVDGIIAKEALEVWKGTNVATGTGLWFRYVEPGDTGTSSTTAARVQGTIGAVAADLLVSNTTFTTGVDFTLNYFSVALPTL